MRSASELTALEDLNLSDTGVTDAGMQALARMKRLRALNLSYTGLHVVMGSFSISRAPMTLP